MSSWTESLASASACHACARSGLAHRQDTRATIDERSGHYSTLVQRSVFAPQPTSALQTHGWASHPKAPSSSRRSLTCADIGI